MQVICLVAGFFLGEVFVPIAKLQCQLLSLHSQNSNHEGVFVTVHKSYAYFTLNQQMIYTTEMQFYAGIYVLSFALRVGHVNIDSCKESITVA